MTARPIRYQRQVSDRKGKIFYTSITSLSHISKLTGDYAVGSVCMDSDFAALVLAKAGKQVDMGYIGTPYGMEGVPGLELTAARWQPLLQPQEEPQKLHDCLFGDRKSTRLNSSHDRQSRMPSSA